MNWNLCTGGCLLVGSLLSSAVFAVDEAAELAEMMESSVQGICEDKVFLNCAAIPVTKCQESVKSIVDQCKAKLPKKLPKKGLAEQVDTLTAAWQTCVNDKLRSSFHLSDALMQKCDALAHGDSEHGHTSTDTPEIKPHE